MKNILEVLDQKIAEQKEQIKKWFDEYCISNDENKQLKQENETLRNDLEQLSVNSFLSEVATENKNTPKITIKFDENQIQIHNLKFEVAELKRTIKHLKKELKRK